ncbi:MAG: bacillithiol biosynthesis deacetylase BshB1 [Candidatus Hydrogenedens sp.]
MNDIDILAFGAHPDDVELGIGGILAKCVQNGLKVGIIDLTRGEMSSRGTVEERRLEAEEAGKIIGISLRDNLYLKDSEVQNVPEQRLPVISTIRKYRPKIIFATMNEDKHPDHHNAHFLIKESNYFSGLFKIKTEYEPYRCPTLLFYYPYYEVRSPNFIVDISEYYDRKINALKAHRSQFFNPGYSGNKTFISSERFWHSIRDRCAYWGSRINVSYAETIFSIEPVNLSSLKIII